MSSMMRILLIVIAALILLGCTERVVVVEVTPEPGSSDSNSDSGSSDINDILAQDAEEIWLDTCYWNDRSSDSFNLSECQCIYRVARDWYGSDEELTRSLMAGDENWAEIPDIADCFEY